MAERNPTERIAAVNIKIPSGFHKRAERAVKVHRYG